MKRSEVQVLLGPRKIAKAINQGDLAQIVEHLLCKLGVRGSTPLVSTKGERPVRNGWSFSLPWVLDFHHDLGKVRDHRRHIFVAGRVLRSAGNKTDFNADTNVGREATNR